VPRPTIASLLLLFALGGCADDGHALLVDLRTDYAPGVEFVLVRTVIEGETTRLAPGVIGADFGAGIRIAEFDGLSEGRYTADVTIENAAGEVVGQRRVQIELSSNLALPLTIFRSCEDVTCGAGLSCIGGACVDEACSPLNPTACPDEGECEDATDCTAAVSCDVGRCSERRCIYVPDDSLCGDGDVCVPTTGCVSPPTDAGTDGAMDSAVQDSGVGDAGDGGSLSDTYFALVSAQDRGSPPYSAAAGDIVGDLSIRARGGNTYEIVFRSVMLADGAPREAPFFGVGDMTIATDGAFVITLGATETMIWRVTTADTTYTMTTDFGDPRSTVDPSEVAEQVVLERQPSFPPTQTVGDWQMTAIHSPDGMRHPVGVCWVDSPESLIARGSMRVDDNWVADFSFITSFYSDTTCGSFVGESTITTLALVFETGSTVDIYHWFTADSTGERRTYDVTRDADALNLAQTSCGPSGCESDVGDIEYALSGT